MDIIDLRGDASILGPDWTAIYSSKAEFDARHFYSAMMNIIRQPNVNSTVIMRADILREEKLNNESGEMDVATTAYTDIDHNTMPLSHQLEDVEPRRIRLGMDQVQLKVSIVRRIIPRNPRRDPVINQTCLVFGSEDESTTVVVYVPHISDGSHCPFYLPPMKAVAIAYHQKEISVHYIPFIHEDLESFKDDTNRSIRIALRLLQTSYKHSKGVMDGYQKRVNHDVIVDKVAFQDRYIILKQKYAQDLTANWVESTDPKKHVFEDLAIAAFLIELWKQMYNSPSEFSFLDVGCGNGLLVHILLSEGYEGLGVDARARKSWLTYPVSCQEKLKEQIIVPRVLLDSNEKSGQELMLDPSINTLDLKPNTFLIGNHSDELTVWIPLFGYPFMVIPCCSHSLSGAKFRFPARSPENKSTYASLVDHVEEVAANSGWQVEKERLRIPSTRNAAIIGRYRQEPKFSVPEIIANEGGADGWVQRASALRSKSPRRH